MDQDLIQVVNKLQETFGSIGGETVDLPQIVVVGSQSSGKSSVLENIVGRDFLPRGSGIVTRRPLVLQLIHTPSSSSSTQPNGVPSSSSNGTSTTTEKKLDGGEIGFGEEYGEFLHTDRRFYDFGDIRKEVENETLRVAGQNKGISRLPMHLKIYSPNVLNLTLVDLPGLTKIPVGDQPTDIERQIRNLVLDYISKPNCVILAISPANVDLANSESLKLARSVDPQGRRTIGVLTKLDLMDAGTNAIDILTGRVYPLKLGFIGVVNRSQQDILDSLEMHKSLEKEDLFFRMHPVYKNLGHRCGTRYLAKTLNQVLMNHIREKLPDMKARLNTLMGQTQQELSVFGDSAFLSGPNSKGTLVLRLMTSFVRDFVSSVDGTSLEISTKELCGGARIYYIFNEVFGHALESINPNDNLNTMDVRTAIRNSTGPRPSLFVPETAFDLLVKPQIKLLEPPSLRCVELVYEELMKICHNCTSTELQRYPRLHAQLIEVVSELLRERLGPTSDYVQSLISIQTAYINTNHPEFVNGSSAARRDLQPNQPPHHHQHHHHHHLSDPSRSSGVGGGSKGQGGGAGPKGMINGPGKAASDGGTEGPEDEETSENGYVVSGNGNLLPNGRSFESKSRAASSPIYDQRPQSAPRLETPGGPPFAGASASQAKESFLNYFFGGSMQHGPPGMSMGAGGGPGQVLGGGGGALTPGGHLMGGGGSRHSFGGGGGAGGFGPRGPLSDYAGGHHSEGARSDNPLVGRRGLEGNAAAYDMKSLDKHLEAPQTEDIPRLSTREEMEISLIRQLIFSYFNIVRESIQDLVPKAVMHLLVNFSRENVQNRVVTSLYKDSLFDDLLFEDEGLTAERTRLKALLDAYREAFKTLSDVF